MKPLFSNFAVAGRAKLRDLIPRSNSRIARFQLALVLLLISAQRLPAPIFELPEKPPQAPGVSVNADGSRTLYEVDNAHHRATSTITGRDGKLRLKIQYELDAAGRFTSRTVFDADGKLQSKTVYTYDKAGRVLEQTQLGKDESILNKIAYSYDRQTGKQAGYSVFDGNGKLVNKTAENVSRPAPAPKPSASPKRPQNPFGESAPGG
jgi:YD repeat-containing protein